MGVLVLLVLLVLVTGVKQSQLLDLSLGLGLEFDNIIALWRESQPVRPAGPEKGKSTGSPAEDLFSST